MGRFFVTGDCHGDFTKLTMFIDKFNLTEEDTILVLGDMGLYWRKKGEDAKAFIEYYEKFYSTNIWFIDGNHENFKLLGKLESSNEILMDCSEHIKYVPRGTLLVVGNKSMLFLGGADSIDRYRRIEGLTWWPQEQITTDDIIKITQSIPDNLHIDYVFTHACPRTIFEKNKVYLCTLTFPLEEEAIDHTSEDNLDYLMNRIQFSNWWFGHYHTDQQLDNKFRCLFHDFLEIDIQDSTDE